MKVNWRWPAAKGNTYKPWYKIAWHFIWIVPVIVTLCAFLLAASIGWGPAEARRVLREVW